MPPAGKNAPSEPAAPRRNMRLEPKAEPKDAGRKQPAKAPSRSLRERFVDLRGGLTRFGANAKKPLLVVVRLVLTVAIMAGIFAAYRLVDRHVRTSPAFAIVSIELEGNERLTEVEILEKAGLALGQNVFAKNPQEASAALLRHPWVAEAEVVRRLPGTFTIRIREHHPVAILSVDRLYLVAEDGAIFKELSTGDPTDLPVINGVDRKRFAEDRTYRTAIVLEVIALMHDYRGAGLWRREPIEEIFVEEDDGLSLYVGADSTYVRLGQPPHRKKLLRLREVLDRIEERKGKAAYVYLDNQRRPDRVTARLRAPRDG